MDDKKEKAIILAEKVKLLFGFCADLIPDKDMLKDVMKFSNENVGRTMAMAPIIGAYGMDYEAAEFEARLRAERSEALFKLIDTLERTENERVEFDKKQKNRKEGREQLAKALGL